jgi:two-component system, HptB-dependent secretion and biofilm response regulator
MKILIANDNPIADTGLANFCQKTECELIITHHEEAFWIELRSPHPVDFVIINCKQVMPDKLRLVQQIRENNTIPQPYIILATDLSEKQNFNPIIEVGIDDYIAHPFHANELEIRLRIAEKNLQLKNALLNNQRILSNEREIIETILLGMRRAKPFFSDHLRIIDDPMENTSGDILLSDCKSNKTQHILLGDFTGHGLTAAVCGPVVFDVFYSMTKKNLAMPEIVSEINRQLLEKMPTRLFMAGVFLELNRHNNALRIWNCGMLDVLTYRKNNLLLKSPSTFLSLGIVEQNFNEVKPIFLQPGDKVYAFSDGITECTNEQNEQFGQDRLEQSLSRLLQDNLALNELVASISRFRGQQVQTDDMTLLELTC